MQGNKSGVIVHRSLGVIKSIEIGESTMLEDYSISRYKIVWSISEYIIFIGFV